MIFSSGQNEQNSFEYKMHMNKLKRRLSGYTLGMAFFVAWLYTFPMYGPLLSIASEKAGSNATQNFLSFVAFHSLGLFLFGYVESLLKNAGQKWHLDITNNNNRIQLFACIGVIAVLTFLYPFLPAVLMPGTMGIIGFFSAFIMAIYQVYLSTKTEPYRRGMKLGKALFIAEFIYIPFTRLTAATGYTKLYFLFFSILLILSVIIFEKNQDVADPERQESKVFSHPYWSVLLLIILGFYFTSGIMYSLAYPGWFASKNYSAAVANSFYMIAAIVAGYLIDRFERIYAILLALSLIGMGYFGLIISHSNILEIVCISLLQIGSAFMDLFVFITLSEMASFDNNPSYRIGWGLSANVFSIFLSNITLYRFGNSILNFYNIKYIGVTIIFILIPVSALLKDKVISNNISIEKKNDIPIDEELPKAIANVNPESVLKKYNLTSRETEIAMWLLEGKSFLEIEEGLGIKNSTVKTHMKKIYNKTNINSQKDLILLVLKGISQHLE